MKKTSIVLIILAIIVVLVGAYAFNYIFDSEKSILEIEKETISREEAIQFALQSDDCRDVITNRTDFTGYNNDINAWVFITSESNMCLSPNCRIFNNGTVERYYSDEPCPQ